MPTSYVASFDLGTSGVKAALVNFNGEVCSVSTEEYGLINPEPHWVEQDPDDYWNAVIIAINNAVKKLKVLPEQIKGVAFGTQWKGIIPLDDQDNVLYNNIIWLDGRAAKQAEELNQKMNTDVMHQQEYWPRLMWVKENMPNLYEKTNQFLEVNSFLKFKATGIKAVDLTNNLIYSENEDLQFYYDQIMKTSGLDQDKFPPLVLPTEEVGGLTKKAAKELGLVEGTPVFGGCGDIPAVAIGAGCSNLNSNHIYLGSSGWFSAITSERKNDIGEMFQSFDQDKEMMVYAIQSASLTLDWAIHQFYRAEEREMGGDIYDFINKEIESVPPGSLNLVAAPWIHGELSPLSKIAKAVFFNVTNQHDRRHFISAIMEGICFMLRWKLENHQKEVGKKVESIRVVGGGASSDRWMQMMANILKIPVYIPESPRHAGSIGTAYCAMVGLGVCEDFNEVNTKISIERTYTFQEEFEDQYDKLFYIFKDLYPTLKDMFRTLND